MVDNENIYPKISIITPSYNQGNFVEMTVRSVLQQNYPNLEYIFMDGGSLDNTLEKIEPYRIHFSYIVSGPDGGQSAAIANGFEKSTGEIMAYLNSDDVLLPGTLKFVAEYFIKNPTVDLIYGHRCIIDEYNLVKGHWILPPHVNFLMRRCPSMPQESCFWRRSLFDRAGNVDPCYSFAMDYDLFVRYMEVGKFKRVQRFLAAFRRHKNAKSSTQYNTIGKDEIEKIRSKYNINNFYLLGVILRNFIKIRSKLYILINESIPGLPSGKNFELNDLWKD